MIRLASAFLFGLAALPSVLTLARFTLHSPFSRVSVSASTSAWVMVVAASLLGAALAESIASRPALWQSGVTGVGLALVVLVAGILTAAFTLQHAVVSGGFGLRAVLVAVLLYSAPLLVTSAVAGILLRVFARRAV